MVEVGTGDGAGAHDVRLVLLMRRGKKQGVDAVVARSRNDQRAASECTDGVRVRRRTLVAAKAHVDDVHLDIAPGLEMVQDERHDHVVAIEVTSVDVPRNGRSVLSTRLFNMPLSFEVPSFTAAMMLVTFDPWPPSPPSSSYRAFPQSLDSREVRDTQDSPFAPPEVFVFCRRLESRVDDCDADFLELAAICERGSAAGEVDCFANRI